MTMVELYEDSEMLDIVCGYIFAGSVQLDNT